MRKVAVCLARCVLVGEVPGPDGGRWHHQGLVHDVQVSRADREDMAMGVEAVDAVLGAG